MQVDEEQQKTEEQQQAQPENKAESEEMEVIGAFEILFSWDSWEYEECEHICCLCHSSGTWTFISVHW